jgi:hypothetical protein
VEPLLDPEGFRRGLPEGRSELRLEKNATEVAQYNNRVHSYICFVNIK